MLAAAANAQVVMKHLKRKLEKAKLRSQSRLNKTLRNPMKKKKKERAKRKKRLLPTELEETPRNKIPQEARRSKIRKRTTKRNSIKKMKRLTGSR